MTRPARKVLGVVGARPNLVKIAPLMRIAAEEGRQDWKLVHTGQHYDDEMSRVFFRDLNIPPPDINLGVGSGTHAAQTANVMLKFEPVVESIQPDLLVVVGDVNSTLAAALVGAKLDVPVAHVEAGLRNFDRTMPEEINRRVTDAISTLLLTPSRDANENLLREGASPDSIHLVGNVMADSLLSSVEEIRTEAKAEWNLRAGSYALATIHRPSNVDDDDALVAALDVLSRVSERLPVVFPVHPRTRARLIETGTQGRLSRCDVILTPPLSYLDFVQLMNDAAFVLTDSGGVQEETTILGVPCLTLRENTERPITVEQGTNTLVGSDPTLVLKEVDLILNTKGKRGRVPDLWDGKASNRIIEVLNDFLEA